MKEQLITLLEQSVQALIEQHILPAECEPRLQIDRPKDKSHGDFATNLALMLAKPAKMNPRTLAEAIVSHLPENTLITKTEIAGPGFINFTLNQEQLVDQLVHAWSDPHLGIKQAAQPQTIVIDYSSTNLAKEMHVGHLRSTIIGDAIARSLSALGHKVIPQNHVGDWGTQFGMLLAHMQDQLEQGESVTLQLSDLEAFYKAAKKRFDDEDGFADRARAMVVELQGGNPECLRLWKQFITTSLEHSQVIYNRLNVQLKPEDVKAESAYNDELPSIVKTLQKQHLLVEDQGAKCVFLDQFKNKEGEPLPIIVQKKDGGYLYATTDLAAIRYRTEQLQADRIIYVVDARQSLHFEQVFAVAKEAGFSNDHVRIEHLGFGLVLGKDGRPYKSRDGGVTKLADLLDEAEKRALDLISSKESSLTDEEKNHIATAVGVASVKYADLSKNRINDYMFDWDTMISFEGNTAPYMMYANTRIYSLFQRAQVQHSDLDTIGFVLEKKQEVELAKLLAKFSEVMQSVGDKGMPNFLCQYLYDLAGAFSRFYEACPILNQDEHIKLSRLKLAALTQRTLEKGFAILGIETLERM